MTENLIWIPAKVLRNEYSTNYNLFSKKKQLAFLGIL